MNTGNRPAEFHRMIRTWWTELEQGSVNWSGGVVWMVIMYENILQHQHSERWIVQDTSEAQMQEMEMSVSRQILEMHSWNCCNIQVKMMRSLMKHDSEVIQPIWELVKRPAMVMSLLVIYNGEPAQCPNNKPKVWERWVLSLWEHRGGFFSFPVPLSQRQRRGVFTLPQEAAHRSLAWTWYNY